MSFVVVRHPQAGLGIIPEAAVSLQEANGWVVVSHPRPQPSDFHLPDFADTVDEPEEPAEPVDDEEQEA